MEYDETRATYNKIAKRWAQGHSNARMWEPEYAKLVKAAGHEAYLLDIGCGAGIDARFFVSVGFNVIGIDFSDNMLKEAKKTAPGGTFINMDMQNLEFGDGAFDALWSHASLVHIKKADVGRVLDGFARVLRKGGVAFFAVKRGVGEEMKTYEDGNRRYYAYYIDGELEKLLAEHGFEVTESSMKADNEGDIWICIFARKPQALAAGASVTSQ